MSSGIAVADDCVTKFNELKLGHAYKYITYTLNADNTQVVVDAVGGKDATYQEFVGKLPANDCRYAVYDFEFDAPEGGKRSKILFVLWAPDGAKVKPKMMYTSTKSDFRKKLVGVGTEIQATDASEIDYETILDKAKKDTR